MRQRFNEEVSYDAENSAAKLLERKNLEAKNLEEFSTKSNNRGALSATKSMNPSKRSKIIKSIRDKYSLHSKSKLGGTAELSAKIPLKKPIAVPQEKSLIVETSQN